VYSSDGSLQILGGMWPLSCYVRQLRIQRFLLSSSSLLSEIAKELGGRQLSESYFYDNADPAPSRHRQPDDNSESAPTSSRESIRVIFGPPAMGCRSRVIHKPSGEQKHETPLLQCSTMAMDNHVRPLVLHPLIAPLACGVVRGLYTSNLVFVADEFMIAIACVLPPVSSCIPEGFRSGVVRACCRSHVLCRFTFLPLLPPSVRSLYPFSRYLDRRVPSIAVPPSCQIPRACPCQGFPILGRTAVPERPAAPSISRAVPQVRRCRSYRTEPPHHP
jgi:hypothetical protein